MSTLEIGPLRGDLGFGARVRGVTSANVRDAAVRKQLASLFEAAGVILFAEIESSPAMQVALSEIAGPLKDHLQDSVARVDDSLLGVIEMTSSPDEEAAIEINGNLLASWLPWHFDHCYNDELNRGGVLRAIEIPPEGGMTGFADGIGLYQALSPELRDRIESRKILYRMNVIMENLRFGRPANYKVFGERPGAISVMDEMAGNPRAVHPAVWTRKTGEKVLHVSPWMAEGIEGAEDAEGDALLDSVCREIFTKAADHSYFHQWKTNEMILWDNWRLLHAVSGHPIQHRRRMQRTTIKGDYGFGYFENSSANTMTQEMSF